MITHNLQQGTPEWHAFRREHFTASDASAMMGESPYKTRSDLLREKHSGIVPEINEATARIFSDGHRFEALARPYAEQIVKEALYPSTGSDGKLSASFDGITLLEDVCWEHKTANVVILSCESVSDLPAHYRIQMEQQLLVSGARECLFMATKWDKNDNLIGKPFYKWYESDEGLRKKIIDGWDQFKKDLECYQIVEIAELPQSQVLIDLPVLFAHATGEITSSNMEEFGYELALKLLAVRSIKLETDQDFSNAKEFAKLFRVRAKQMKATKEAMLAQTESIGEASRKMDAWADDLNKTALQLEKDVEREDMAKKRAMITEASLVFAEYVRELEAETKPILLNIPKPDFAEAIKNKRNYKSMHDAIQTLLSQAKSAATSIAMDILGKLDWYHEYAGGYAFLFSDLSVLITKPFDDFCIAVNYRIEKHIADEAAKLEEQRTRIEAEATAKAEREAAVKIAEAEAVIRADERAKAEAIASQAREEAAKVSAAEASARAAHEVEERKIAEAQAVEDYMATPVKTSDAVRIDAHDTINDFMRINDFGSGKEKIRTVLVEFVKFQSAQK